VQVQRIVIGSSNSVIREVRITEDNPHGAVDIAASHIQTHRYIKSLVIGIHAIADDGTPQQVTLRIDGKSHIGLYDELPADIECKLFKLSGAMEAFQHLAAGGAIAFMLWEYLIALCWLDGKLHIFQVLRSTRSLMVKRVEEPR